MALRLWGFESPCRTCAMLIINCVIDRVVCEKRCQAAVEPEAMFEKAGVVLEYVSQEVLKYTEQ